MAALPIASDLKAPELYDHLDKILHGLISRNVQVISYACDGTEIERAVERLLVQKAEKVETYTIPGPAGARDIVVQVLLVYGQAMTILQDSKHALKTLRNNLFSGARCLTFGNYVSFFEHINELANEGLTNLSAGYIEDGPTG